MTEESVPSAVNADPSLDQDSSDDAQKGATIGGIGGAVAGAVTGSMAGPLGTIAGAVIGGIIGAVTSKAAVGAIDRIEHAHDAADPGDATPVSDEGAPMPAVEGLTSAGSVPMPPVVAPANQTHVLPERYEEPEELPLTTDATPDQSH